VVIMAVWLPHRQYPRDHGPLPRSTSVNRRRWVSGGWFVIPA